MKNSTDKALEQQIKVRKIWLRNTQAALNSNRYKGIPLTAYNVAELKRIYHKVKAGIL